MITVPAGVCTSIPRSVSVMGWAIERASPVSTPAGMLTGVVSPVLVPYCTMHCPEVHATPALHALPQAPQLAGSLVSFTHAVPQVTKPAPHEQAPSTHVSLAGQ